MKIPTSWLTPAVAVHRSALPPRIQSELLVGMTWVLRLVESIGVQSLPVLPLFKYCWLLEASIRFAATGKRCIVSRVGEKFGQLPAAATIVAVVALLVFHCSLMVYAVPAVSCTTVCT